MTIHDFPLRKRRGQAVSMLTCYDATFARLVSRTDIDCILVGDSCAMTIYGEETTLNTTVQMIAAHTRAVRKGAPDAFIVADMPFLCTRKTRADAVTAAGELLIAGAQAVKIEGIRGNEDIVSHLVESGIPVMGHLGLTPQFYHLLGGWKVQGRSDTDAQRIAEDAEHFYKAGAFALVLECVPELLASRICSRLPISVIGIGAGRNLDGQVLVLQDVLGLTEKPPSFVRTFLDGHALVMDALNQFHNEIQSGSFPGIKEIYTA